MQPSARPARVSAGRERPGQARSERGWEGVQNARSTAFSTAALLTCVYTIVLDTLWCLIATCVSLMSFVTEYTVVAK